MPERERSQGRSGGPVQELTDAQWEKIAPLLPEPKRSGEGGRPSAGNRSCLEGILWVLRSGARWKDLPRGTPQHFPSATTCWRRLRDWERAGLWLKVWRTLLGELDGRGRLDWEEAFADGSFAPAKKGGRASARPARGRARSGWWWSTAKVFLWESTWTRPPRPKSNSSRRRSGRSRSRGQARRGAGEAGPGGTPDA